MKLDFSKLELRKSCTVRAREIIDLAESAGLVIGLDRAGALVVGGRLDVLDEWWPQISTNRIAIIEALEHAQREMHDMLERLLTHR